MRLKGEANQSAAVPAAWLHGQLVAIRRRWWLIPAMLVAALLIAGLYLRQAQYLYTAELRVHAAPSSSGARATSSALGGLAALSRLGGASEQVSPFRFYLDGIHGSEVAARLARDRRLMHRLFAGEWDARRRVWRQPPSLAGSLRRGLSGLLGLPQFAWQPPDAARLQDYIAGTIAVRQSVKTPLVSISYSNPDPALAIAFLARVHAVTDAYLREQQSARTRGNIDYLSQRLALVTIAEQRAALVTALTEQERQAMLVHGDAPYAAEPFDTPKVSPEPTRPRPLALLAGATAAGVLLGTVLAAITGRRRNRPIPGTLAG